MNTTPDRPLDPPEAPVTTEQDPDEAYDERRQREIDERTTLPPDPDGMNPTRSIWAATAIAAFRNCCGTDLEDAVADLLADLMHYCDYHDLDFDNELRRAQGHYEPETWINDGLKGDLP